VTIEVVAVRTGGTDATGVIGDSARQTIECTVKDVGGTLSVVPAVAVTLANYSLVASNIMYHIPWADTNFINGAAFTNGTTVLVSVVANKIHVTVTGEADKTIRWQAHVHFNWIGWRNFAI